MSFESHLQEDHYDLLNAARSLGVNIALLEGVYTLSPSEALRLLRKFVADKQKDAAKINHVAAFVERNAQSIQRFVKARDALLDVLDTYNSNNSANLFVDYDADTEGGIIQQGKKIRRKPENRDYAAFVTVAREAGYQVDKLRISPSEDEGYVYGAFNEDGSITSEGMTFARPADWMGHVFNAAIQRGTRSDRRGSPIKAISLPNAKGNYSTLETVYNDLAKEDHLPIEEYSDFGELLEATAAA